MQKVEFSPGTSIEEAATALVINSPAKGDFNGIEISAKNIATNPADIVAHYWAETEARAIIWRNSDEGKRFLAEQEADRAARQTEMNALIERLPSVDMTSISDVLTWVESAARPADHVGVSYDHAAVVKHFEAHGWGVNVNTGDDFDGKDPRNFAGWIVGQWLHCRYPGVVKFIAPLRGL